MSDLSRESVFKALSAANEKGESDQEVALMAAVYVQEHTPLDLNETTLAAAMFTLADRAVTTERAEHLLEQMDDSGFVEDA